jgi:hypothetical protein
LLAINAKQREEPTGPKNTCFFTGELSPRERLNLSRTL